MKKYILTTLLFLIVCVTLFGVNPLDKRTFRIGKNLTVYNNILRELDMFYVDTLNYDKIVKQSIDNMLAKLDPYTVYMPEEETDDLTFMTTGEYAGIGAMISKNGNRICISEPYEHMPAQRNGVKAGDILLEVDGVNVENMSVEEVSNRLKGTPGTTIKLKINRPGTKRPVLISFVREKIQINPVSYFSSIGNKTGYVQLSEFTDRAAIELKLAINEMVKSNQIESLVLDLRNNGGGLVDEAVKILGFFLPKGTLVVTTKGKNEEAERAYHTPSEPVFPNMKLIVLTNRASASASEILAGSIQDLDRGVIVGERTYGKGLVQNIRTVGYGGHLKVTTAKYYIPSGRCIQAIDYSHRNDDGSVGRVPDSLTTEFKTRNGRKVRDGGGVVPDSVTLDERKLNVAYYIFMQNLYFDFATQYVLNHSTIAPAADFSVSDEEYSAFCQYLKEKKFTYTSQTQKFYNELEEAAKIEGLDELAKAEFSALKAKLTPDVSKSLELNKSDVLDFLNLEIIKRYYYQKGEIQYSLRDDKDLKLAQRILATPQLYEKIVSAKP